MTLSPEDKARRDAARHGDGTFGTQHHGEAPGGPDALQPAPVFSTTAAIAELDAMEDTTRRAEARYRHLNARRSHLAAQAAAGMVRERFPDAANIIFEDHHVHGLLVDHVTDAAGVPLGLGPGDQFELYDSSENPYFSELVESIDFGEAFAGKDYASTRPDTGRPRYMYTVEIGPLLDDPAPADASWDTDPRTKALSADEQDDLIEAAYHALPAIEDAEESADDPGVRQRHEELRIRLQELLAGARAGQ